MKIKLSIDPAADGWYLGENGDWYPPDDQDHEKVADVILPDGTIIRYPKEAILLRSCSL